MKLVETETCDMQTTFLKHNNLIIFFCDSKKPMTSSLASVVWEGPTHVEWRDLFLETDLKSSAN